jgi:hypothetical protein
MDDFNPVGLLWHVLYSMMANATAYIGLTPAELGAVLGGLVVALIVGQLVIALFSKGTWSLYDEAGDE